MFYYIGIIGLCINRIFCNIKISNDGLLRFLVFLNVLVSVKCIETLLVVT